MGTDYRSMYEKEFIGSWDLETDKTITITRVKAGELTGVGGRKTKKPVVFFKGSEKGFALNATNGKTIATLYGNHVEDWVGKSITLYKSMTQMAGADTECIRVRPQAPKGNGAFQEEEVAPGDAECITPDQALELEALCTEGGADLSAKFKKVGKVERFSQVLAVDYASSKKWVTQQRLKEHEGSQA